MCTKPLWYLHVEEYLSLFSAYADVAGVITGVSPATQYHSANRTDPSTKRIIYLSDVSYVSFLRFLFCNLFHHNFSIFSLLIWVFVAGSGHQISIVLWGERAIAFEGDWVLETSKKSPVIAIFVGCLVKNYDGRCTNLSSLISSFVALLFTT